MPLLIPNRKLPLRLLIILRKPLQAFHTLIPPVHFHQKLHIALRVFMARIYRRVIWQLSQFRQRSLHLGGGPFEEFPAPTDEERVPREDGALGWVMCGIDHVVADGVLGVAGGVERGDGDVFSDVEDFAVFGGGGYGGAVFAADDGEFFVILVAKGLEDAFVAAGVVPVVMGVDDGGEVDGAGHAVFQGGEDFVWVGGVDDYGGGGGFVGDEVGVVVGGAYPHGDGFDLHGADLDLLAGD